ncbi:uncharacterized protein LOC123676230 isoform X2 [Harmonia axyridis]|uniref:uncharacterized protein LOC123676230 isoform X2 n=1 Tax=Harmonia axyridis TaxID=115357 RepID=UPI001E277246|nr:uncharacterized protein LOC123676230 isoform X2 [Harmonia axyridis]
MLILKESVVIVLTLISVFLKFSECASVKTREFTTREVEDIILKYLDTMYYNTTKNPLLKDQPLSIRKKNGGFEINLKKTADLYDTMQGDQPVDGENNVENEQKPLNSTGNTTDINVLQASRNRFPVIDGEERSKDNWIQLLKMNILQQVGRVNTSDASKNSLNLTQLFPNNSNETNPLEEFISKKIRTFYPSCSIPEAPSQEFRTEEKMMNLYFNYTQDDPNNQIGEATLRLHALIQKNSTHAGEANCSHQMEEEEKVYRISAYYYVKNSKGKRRAKKRLCDSRVIAESSRYVELNMANAVRAWNNEQNLGLAVEVEDQDGKLMKTEKYFMGPSCSVGVSTPKPIPNIILDNAASSEQFFRLLGRNSTSPLTGNILLLPTLEVCTLGLPVNPPNSSNLRKRDCNLLQLQDQTHKVLEKDKLERLATLTSELRPSMASTHRHLRHQRNYLDEKLAESDTKILMTKEQVLALFHKLNITNIRT